MDLVYHLLIACGAVVALAGGWYVVQRLGRASADGPAEDSDMLEGRFRCGSCSGGGCGKGEGTSCQRPPTQERDHDSADHHHHHHVAH